MLVNSDLPREERPCSQVLIVPQDEIYNNACKAQNLSSNIQPTIFFGPKVHNNLLSLYAYEGVDYFMYKLVVRFFLILMPS